MFSVLISCFSGLVCAARTMQAVYKPRTGYAKVRFADPLKRRKVCTGKYLALLATPRGKKADIRFDPV